MYTFFKFLKNFVYIEIFKRIQSIHSISCLSGKQEVEGHFLDSVWGSGEGRQRERGKKKVLALRKSCPIFHSHGIEICTSYSSSPDSKKG